MATNENAVRTLRIRRIEFDDGCVWVREPDIVFVLGGPHKFDHTNAEIEAAIRDALAQLVGVIG